MEYKKIQKFTDLKVWQEGHKLVLLIYKITANFPNREIHCLIDQMRRAAVSITSNIAEGFAKRTAKEKNRFYYIAQASLIELQNQLIIAKDLKYLTNQKFKEIALQSVSVNKLLNAFITSTKNKKFEK